MLRVRGHGACERETLTLPAGQAEPLLADLRLDALRQLVDEAGLRDLERLGQDALGLGRGRIEVVPAEQHVVAHGRREQGRILERHRDRLAQVVAREVAHVDAVDPHRIRPSRRTDGWSAP